MIKCEINVPWRKQLNVELQMLVWPFLCIYKFSTRLNFAIVVLSWATCDKRHLPCHSRLPFHLFEYFLLMKILPQHGSPSSHKNWHILGPLASLVCQQPRCLSTMTQRNYCNAHTHLHFLPIHPESDICTHFFSSSSPSLNSFPDGFWWMRLRENPLLNSTH